MLNRAVEDLNHISAKDTEPKRFGRNITLIVSPFPVNKRKMKYGEPVVESSEAEE